MKLFKFFLIMSATFCAQQSKPMDALGLSKQTIPALLSHSLNIAKLASTAQAVGKVALGGLGVLAACLIQGQIVSEILSMPLDILTSIENSINKEYSETPKQKFSLLEIIAKLNAVTVGFKISDLLLQNSSQLFKHGRNQLV